jgi:hypothetical protein
MAMEVLGLQVLGRRADITWTRDGRSSWRMGNIARLKCIQRNYNSDLNCTALYLQGCLDRHTVLTEKFMSVFKLGQFWDMT